MTAKSSDLVIGVFDHPTQAEQALAELRRAGFPNRHIDLAGGAVPEGGAGKTRAVPGIGRVLVDGLLSGMVGEGALPGGTFFGLLVALDLSEDDARYYSEAAGEGRTVVLVRTPDRQAEARALLNRHAAHDRDSQRPEGSYL